MKSLKILTLAAAAAMTVSGAAAAKECKPMAAVGTGLTKGIAEIMANGGIKTIIDTRGMTPEGPIKMKCVDGTFVTECTAQQRACK